MRWSPDVASKNVPAAQMGWVGGHDASHVRERQAGGIEHGTVCVSIVDADYQRAIRGRVVALSDRANVVRTVRREGVEVVASNESAGGDLAGFAGR